MRFYLGTHEPAWLARSSVPMFISHRRLARRKTNPARALGPWALDSGGFSELSMFGHWKTSATQYAEAVETYAREIGNLEWIAPQDWMCEPFMLEKTGLSIREHQERTIASVLELRAMLPDVQVIPVLQGWRLNDYELHTALYAAAGIMLFDEPVVGIGSVCRRQHTGEIEAIICEFSRLKLHAFGAKTEGLSRYGYLLTSADSMSWSYRARRALPLPECKHASCSNCLRFALRWREKVLDQLVNQQLHLDVA